MNTLLDPQNKNHRLGNRCCWSPNINFPECKHKRQLFWLVQENWQKIQGLALAKENQKTDIRIVLKSFVALALIREDVFFGSEKMKNQQRRFKIEKNAESVCYWDATWLEERSLRWRRTGTSCLPRFGSNWKMPKKCAENNAVEGWHGAI